MNWNEIYDSWDGYFGQFPNILFTIVVFLIGWLFAALIGRGIRSLLQKATWDDKLFQMARIGENVKPHLVLSKIVFYLFMIFVVIICLNMLNLQFVAEPIINMMTIITQAIPNILKAALILLIAWVIATVLSFFIQKGGRRLGIDQLLAKWNLSDNPEDADKTLKTAGRVVYYLVLLMFLPGVLGALHIAAVSDPLSGMLGQLLQFLPKLFGALLILLIGWLIAKIVREILVKFLQSVGLEKLAERAGLSKLFGNANLSAAVGTIVYILILIPVVISALETLNLEGISGPAIAMLTSILTIIPNIVIGIVLVLIGVWLGRLIGNFVARLLEGLGFNSILRQMGLGRLEASDNAMTASQIVGRIAQIVVVLLFVVEALQMTKLQVLAMITTAIIAYLPSLFVAIVIIGLGLFLGNLVKRILSSVVQSSFAVLGIIAKYTIITLSVFMALDQLGVAGSIVNAAFILTLGGFALAFGLAFGLGGREFASEWLIKWQNKAAVASKSVPPTPPTPPAPPTEGQE